MMSSMNKIALCLVFVMAVTLTVGQRRQRKKNWKSAGNEELEETVQNLQNTVATLGRQLMMQQFYVEEQTRSNGNSGLKKVRNIKQGTRPYYSGSHVSNTMASIHDHANLPTTVGMGEFIGVLNGVEFRTRHNDYLLKMKSNDSSQYGATQDIPLPPVPPEVTQHLSEQDQVDEMKKWFEAWAKQDDSERNYKDYFKPVLCYLEGMWTNSDQTSIEEPFDSERHHIDAKSWLDLQDKIRFTSYSGTKDGLENFAYLPTTVFSILNETIPVLAQWNFQILCHPLKNDLPLNRLNLVDDLKAKLSLGLTVENYKKSRAARFQLSPDDSDTFTHKRSMYSFLDDLMHEIPGADNYPGHIEDTLMGDTVYPYSSRKKNPLNVAYFHRSYRVKRLGAMGLNNRRRGFADENMFLAQTTNPKIAGLPIEKCDRKGENCQQYFQRWTYAIPLEIIYLTPLSSWNPYNIQYKGPSNKREGKTIYEGPNGKRNGKETLDQAYNGTNSKVYYMTPLDFFQDQKESDPADTTLDYTCVLDAGGNMRRVRATGHRIFLPEIPGVGQLRQRYPIMPIHGEGESVWKELSALADVVLNPSKYRNLFEEGTEEDEEENDNGHDPDYVEGNPLFFKLAPANADNESHTHHFELTPDDAKRYMAGQSVNVVTEEASGHSHELNVARLLRNGTLTDLARRCDGEMWCWDGHHRRLIRVVD